MVDNQNTVVVVFVEHQDLKGRHTATHLASSNTSIISRLKAFAQLICHWSDCMELMFAKNYQPHARQWKPFTQERPKGTMRPNKKYHTNYWASKKRVPTNLLSMQSHTNKEKCTPAGWVTWQVWRNAYPHKKHANKGTHESTSKRSDNQLQHFSWLLRRSYRYTPTAKPSIQRQFTFLHN